MPAPELGQHNDAILRDELGASEEDLAELRASGAISEVPIDPA
jgi:crotonobetainyl-CoA:carnitine CoA-transferase CaiB-like acyl-CoA transferase